MSVADRAFIQRSITPTPGGEASRGASMNTHGERSSRW